MSAHTWDTQWTRGPPHPFADVSFDSTDLRPIVCERAFRVSVTRPSKLLTIQPPTAPLPLAPVSQTIIQSQFAPTSTPSTTIPRPASFVPRLRLPLAAGKV